MLDNSKALAICGDCVSYHQTGRVHEPDGHEITEAIALLVWIASLDTCWIVIDERDAIAFSIKPCQSCLSVLAGPRSTATAYPLTTAA